ECTITLEDVAVLFGLPIDRNAITGVSSISRPATLYYDLLGSSPSEGKFTSLRFSWLKVNFEHLSSTASEWKYILTLPVRLGDIHGINKRGKHGNDWVEVHEEYVSIWTNQLGWVPQMDRALDLQPSLKYIQWYSEMGKPILFGGLSMVVPRT
ncbi:hypothetical protein J1N35_011844, partial [Gossypium stocksii]